MFDKHPVTLKCQNDWNPFHLQLLQLPWWGQTSKPPFVPLRWKRRYFTDAPYPRRGVDFSLVDANCWAIASWHQFCSFFIPTRCLVCAGLFFAGTFIRKQSCFRLLFSQPFQEESAREHCGRIRWSTEKSLGRHSRLGNMSIFVCPAAVWSLKQGRSSMTGMTTEALHMPSLVW